QIRNAAGSITLNLSEGQRSGGGNQRRHYEIAHGSANEVKGALAVAEAWGWLDEAGRARRILDRSRCCGSSHAVAAEQSQWDLVSPVPHVGDPSFAPPSGSSCV